MRFRQDISGLRALAVVPIVLLHADVKIISGGFVGVDIFFVISGYLITCIIVREMDLGSFSILGFYRRRALRILPALIVLLAATLVVGCLVMFPSELRELGSSVAAAAGFGSNMFFWRTSGYFQAPTIVMPLLHTWSLGVEEQFYLFYPLLLLAAKRLAPNRLRLLVGLSVALSFVVSLRFSVTGPAGAFYLLPTRAWELGLGALVALDCFPTNISRRLVNTGAIVGLSMVVIALFAISEKSQFPAPWGLLPALGTALLIAYGETAPTSKFLRLAPMQWIGTISYSLYLWHWPILAFWRLTRGVSLHPWEVAVTIGLGLLAAMLSYQIVERPIMRRFRDAQTLVLGAALTAIAVTFAAGLAVSYTSGHWRHFAPDVQRASSYLHYRGSADFSYQFRPGRCHTEPGDAASYDAAYCLRPATDRPNVLLIGDSMSGHIWRAMAERHPSVNLMQASFAGCRPGVFSQYDTDCALEMHRALLIGLRTHQLARVVIAGHWQPDDIPSLQRLVRWLVRGGHRVTVIGPPNEYNNSFPILLARAIERRDRRLVDDSRISNVALDRRLAPLMVAAGADYRSVLGVECPRGLCTLRAPSGSPLLFDELHLTLESSRMILARDPIF